MILRRPRLRAARLSAVLVAEHPERKGEEQDGREQEEFVCLELPDYSRPTRTAPRAKHSGREETPNIDRIDDNPAADVAKQSRAVSRACCCRPGSLAHKSATQTAIALEGGHRDKVSPSSGFAKRSPCRARAGPCCRLCRRASRPIFQSRPRLLPSPRQRTRQAVRESEKMLT